MATMPDLDRLKSQLLTSGLQQKDFPLYQVIDQLIQALRQTINTVDDALGLSGGGSGSALGQTFGTVANEKASLPASRQLTAGTGIQFNDTFDRLIISGTLIPGTDGEPGEEGPMGLPGIQGPAGATGPAGSGGGSGMPFYFPEEQEQYPDSIPVIGNFNGAGLPTNIAFTNVENIFTEDQVVANVTPYYVLTETTQPANLRVVGLAMSGGVFFLQALNDARTIATGQVNMDRTGVFTALSGLGATPLNATQLTSGTVADARLSANVALENVINQFTLNQRIDNSGGDFPRLTLKLVGGAVDAKVWQILLLGANLTIWSLNDAESAVMSAFDFGRNGVFTTGHIATGGLSAGANVNFTGRSSVSLAADQTAWNPSGLGSVFFIRVSPTAAWNIRGILAQADGYIVTFFNPTGNTISFQHEDAAASAADRLQVIGGITSTINFFRAATFQYDGTAARWVLIWSAQ